MKKYTSILFVLFALGCLAASAAPGRRTVVVTQPDGSRLQLCISGDEYMKIVTDREGHAVIRDDSGRYCYAAYGADGTKSSTGYAVGSDVPSDVLAGSLSIPYQTLALQADRLRSGAESIRSVRLASECASMQDRGPVAAMSAAVRNKCCVVIPAQFADIPMTYSQAELDDVFNAKDYSRFSATGSVKDYYDDQLGPYYNFSFIVTPVVSLREAQKFYGANKSGGGDKNAHGAVAEACRTACMMGFDFSACDGDGDGEVDNVFIIVSGMDEAEGGGDNAIWGHQWYLKDGAGIDLVLNGKRINTYTMCSELAYRSATRDYRIASIGTLCHEYGHSLGLMDMYDTDGTASGGYSEAFWSTGLMDTGCYNGDGNTPSHFNAVDYDTLGVGECTELGTGSYTLNPIRVGREFYRISGPVEGESYLLECRDKVGWDSFNKGAGLAIYHVDRTATYGKPMWWLNKVNVNPKHQCADMIEPVSNPSSAADAFFPRRGCDSFSAAESPYFKWWNGNSGKFVISGISFDGTRASFSVADASEVLIPASATVASEAFQTSAIVSVTTPVAFKGTPVLVDQASGTEHALKSLGDKSFVALLSGLEPSRDYLFDVRLDVAGLCRTVGTVKMRTEAMGREGEAHIHLGASRTGKLHTGDAIPLEIFDAPAVDDIRWYFDGKSIFAASDGYWHVTGSGLLKAVLMLTDGGKEIITKEITVSK